MNQSKLYFIGFGTLFIGLLLAPSLGAYPVFVMKLMCFALFASSFNLLLGYTGLLSFGHAAFMGGAAYVAGHAIKVWSVTPELGIVLGMLAGAFIGLVVGLIATRRHGIYFSMITLALAQMFYFLCLQAPFTNGEDGLLGVPRGKLLGVIDLSDDNVLYYFALFVVTAGFLVIARTVHSPFGQILRAIKDNEPRAISLGYNVSRFKLLAFVISAAVAGVAGALKTVVLGGASLTDVHWTTSGHVILMTLIGGIGTLFGPILGAGIVVALETKIGDVGGFLARLSGVEWFTKLGESVTMVTGLIFILCVVFFRNGIVGRCKGNK